MNKQICILTFSHSEASLCLAKSLALLGYKVDFYFVTDVTTVPLKWTNRSLN